MKNARSLSRRFASRLGRILLGGFSFVTLSGTAFAPELQIKSVFLDSPNHLIVAYDAQAGSTYTLLQGHSVTNINTPVATNTGVNGAAFFSQTVAPTNREGYFRIAAMPD